MDDNFVFKSELNEKYQRLLADFDNYRKRTEKQKLQYYDEGVKNVIDEFAPIINNFEQVINNVEEDNKIKYSSFFDGYKMILQQFKQALNKIGIEEFGEIGEDFDPNLHEAIANFSNAIDKKDKIVEVLNKGYKFNDKIIRYAKVVVG